jgi:hypothetical protein
VSTVYPKPAWQQGIAALDAVSGRAYPDISMDADDGTSQASPTLAGILALATQLRGTDLGTINPALAHMGPRGTAAGIVDVPAGFTNDAFGVPGFATAAGYDIASGWGTIYAPDFVPALVNQIDTDNQTGVAPFVAARQELKKLSGAISVSAGQVAQGQSVTVTGAGFVPGRSPNGTTIVDGFGVFPPLPGQFGAPSGGPFADPNSTVPGQTWDDITATLSGPHSATQSLDVTGPDGDGVVTADIDTSTLDNGRYTVTFTGRLISETTTFQVKQ